VASTESAGQSTIQKLLSGGVTVGWFGLLILAGAIPIAPFSFLGYAGANLMVTGSIAWAAAKVTVQLGMALASKFLTAYYPDLWIYSWILMYSPWYIFDIIQLFSPTFAMEGFKIPFVGTHIGTKGGTGKLTLAVLAAIIAITAMGGYSLMDYIPPEISGSVQPIMKTVFAVVGGGVALAGGGLGAYTMLPGLLKSVSGSVAQIGAVAPVAAVARAPVAPAPVTPVPFTPQQKGGARGTFDLDAIAKEIMGTPAKADTESYVFVGVLGVAVFGGIGLAYLRSQQS
jgi:hypothetical protein